MIPIKKQLRTTFTYIFKKYIRNNSIYAMTGENIVEQKINTNY